MNETTIDGSSFDMPQSDATISVGATDVWGVSNTPAADGSADHPYVITNTQGLDLLAASVNNGETYSGKYFQLDRDITYAHITDWNDATSTEDNYTAIGGYTYVNDGYVQRLFEGTFDGNNKTVSGIRIYKGGSNENTDSYLGLFGMIDGGEVKK